MAERFGAERFGAAMFDAICTSPTYGNRMADHHEARDGSPRHTYRPVLGRPLTPGNSGALLMLGFVCTRRMHVPCPGQRHGVNGHLRVEYESVLQFRRDR